MADRRGPVVSGIPNRIKRGGFYIVDLRSNGSLNVAAMPHSNLTNEETSEAESARILTIDPHWAGWTFEYHGQQGVITPFGDALGIAAASLSPTGLWRLFGGGINLLDAAPNTVVSSANVAGSIAGEAGFATETTVLGNAGAAVGGGAVGSAASANITYSWDYPMTGGGSWDAYGIGGSAHTEEVIEGEHMGQIVVRAYLDATAYTTTDYSSRRPRLKVELYDGVTLIRSLGERAITADNQLLIWTFDPAEIASDFTNIRVKVSMWGAANKYGLRDLGLYWSQKAIGAAVLDSGYVESTAVESADDADTPAPAVMLEWFAPTGTKIVQTGADGWFFRVQFVDDQATHDPADVETNGQAYYSSLTQFPLGYTQAAVAVLGDAIWLGEQEGHGLQGVPAMGVRKVSASGGGVTGGSYAADTFHQRTIEFNVLIDRDENELMMQRVDWKRGGEGAIWVSLEPDIDPKYKTFTSGFWIVEEAGKAEPFAASAYYGDGRQLYTKRYALAEKL